MKRIKIICLLKSFSVFHFSRLSSWKSYIDCFFDSYRNNTKSILKSDGTGIPDNFLTQYVLKYESLYTINMDYYQ